MRDKEALIKLEGLLKSPDLEMRDKGFSQLFRLAQEGNYELINKIASSDDKILKISFCKYIAKYKQNKEGLKILSFFMEDVNEHLRVQALEAFSSIECQGKKEVVLEMLLSKNDYIVDYAIDESGKRRLFGAAGAMAKLYEESEVDRKIKIVKQFQFIRSTECVNTLVNALEETDETLLLEIIQTLGVFHKYVSWHKAMRFINHNNPSVRKAAVWLLNHYKSKIIKDKLIKCYFEERDVFVRNEIVEGLSRYQDFKIAAELSKMAVYSEDNSVRLLADSALDKFPEKLLYKLLKKYRGHSDSKFRAFAILKSANITPSKKVINWITNTLRNDASEYVRSCAAETLGELGDKSALNYLEYSFLMDKSPTVSYNALLSLTKLWEEKDLNKIYTILEFPEEKYAHAQIIALRFIQKKLIWQHWGIYQELSDRIMFRLYSSNTEIRYLCVEILRLLKEKKALVPLIDIYTSALHEEDKLIALKAIGDITYDDPLFLLAFIINSKNNKKLFKELIRLVDLVEFENRYYYEIVVQLTTLFLRERSKDIKKAIVDVLLNIFKRKNESVSEIMANGNEHWITIILECAKYSTEDKLKIFGSDIFLNNLSHPDLNVQKIAVIMLGALREPKAINPLTKMAFKHSSLELRALAKKAVHSILNKENAA